MTYSTLHVYKDGVLGVIKIASNDHQQQMLEELLQAFQKWEAHEGVHYVVILNGNHDHGAEEQADAQTFAAVCATIEASDKVTIAAIDGAATNGLFELALACDIRIATCNTIFCLQQTTSVHALTSSTQRFTRLFGKSIALHYVLTGDCFDANRAYQLGIILDVTTSEALWETILQKVHKMERKQIQALRLAKLIANDSQQQSVPQGATFERMAHVLSTYENIQL